MKNAYITLLGTEKYLDGVLALNESLKNVESKFPLIVAITKKIPNEMKDILKSKSINFIEIENVEIPKDILEKNSNGVFSHWNNTFEKLKIFELTEYDKLVLLDSDMYVRRNIDELFSKKNFSAVIDRREPNISNDWLKLTSGTMVIEPKNGIVNEFIEILKNIKDKREAIGDQDVLQEYYKNWEKENELHLDVKYNTFFIYADYYIQKQNYKLDDISIIHFIFKTKPWELKNENDIKDYMEFIDNRLKTNYQKTKKEVYKECLECGNYNKTKILKEYLELIKTIKKV